ncbi:hypothetical protein [Ferribacterium limneticum]|uniref:hypothetical protein n=1 Tax=Ferribacterium limneticum TaxID=76259 RepID=UPI001CFBE468|nr:hypothetical protein [Ferribacterium limneticum]UCV19800.1 hypothetical protein KI610_04285 [Ferribacterium limneticum]
MIEELTPIVLAISMLVVIAVSTILSLLISTLVLAAYRRRVLGAMAQHAGDAPAPESDDAKITDRTVNFAGQQPAHPTGATLYQRARQAALGAAWRIALGGFSFALVIAVATSLAFADQPTATLFVLALWGASWPTGLALVLATPPSRRLRLAAVAGYFTLFVVGAIVSEVATQRLGTAAGYLHSIAPPQMLAGWLVANGPPTVLLLLFVNRRVRAIGPLVLGFATALSSGLMATYLLLMTPAGWRWLELAANALGLSPFTVLAILAIIVLALGGMLGWRFLSWIRNAYLRKQVNDRSLTLDALCLLFASWYAMALTLAGLAWVLAGGLAFAAGKVTTTWAGRRLAGVDAPGQPRGLVFLRVFSLGARSDRLFDAIARYWRYIGSIDLITGPDIAHSTVQPHQLLDFLAGRLATHFVASTPTLDERLRQRDTAPDRDGWFRVNNFFCHADTWERVLPRLVQGGAVVLMDLRNFSGDNAGCVHELRHLVGFVPLRRCVLVVDETTDQAFLRQTLEDAWQAMPEQSPNRSALSSEANLHHLGSGAQSLRALLQRLCDAA